MDKKKSANWYIAATHYLTAGFLVPFIMNLLFAYLSLLFHFSTAVNYVVAFIVVILTTWLGVIYSSKYITRKYIISNIQSIVNISTVYLVVIQILYMIGKYNQVGSTTQFDLIYVILSKFCVFILFYVFSKKYIYKYYSLQNSQAPTP